MSNEASIEKSMGDTRMADMTPLEDTSKKLRKEERAHKFFGGKKKEKIAPT